MNHPSGKPKHGMMLGKFMPPHFGHVYLADFARHYVSDLTIVVGTLPTEPIPGELRFSWMQSLFPDCEVVHLDQVLPQDPSEHPDFWTLWQNALTEILPHPPEYVFASETYGHKLAEILKARFIPVDRARSIRPISGTAVREDPYQHWDLIPPCVRAYYVKKICVFGPESTGKSILARNLADHFATTMVPEYARTYLEEQDGRLDFEDIEFIARGQIASEDSLIPYCDRRVFLDTDVLATTIWSRFLYQQCPEWIDTAARERAADLYLLTDVDVPWVEDQVRYLPENRIDFHAKCVAALDGLGVNYVRLSGTWGERFEKAVSAVSKLINESRPS